jgi:pimeloyl-ACP methyl ester carboxylesterase
MGELPKLTVEDHDVDAAGARLAVRRLRPPMSPADAPTMVFLHEGLGCIESWRAFPAQLVAATGLPAMVYDRRGYGRSDPLARPWNIDYLHRAAVEELPAVLAACGIERPLLVGHSDGGSIALLYAAHRCPVGVVTEAAHVFVEQAARDGIRRTLEWWDTGDLRPLLERHHGPKTEAIFRSWADTWLAPWFDGWSIVDDLAKVTCPALLLQGSGDEYATPEHLDEIAARLGGTVTVELIAECGHSPHYDRPDLVSELISRWIMNLASSS